MFDLSFAELMVVAVVALVVIGPEELPGLLRQWGRFVGAARRHWRDIWQELEAEAPPPGKVQGDDGQWYESYGVEILEDIAPTPEPLPMVEMAKSSITKDGQAAMQEQTFHEKKRNN